MALWDGLAVDPNAAAECGNILKDTASTVGEQKSFSTDDKYTTISANSNCSLALDSVNEVCGKIGDYLNIDKSNLATIAAALAERDTSEATSYSSEG